jgi:hypothetical protein
MLSGDIKGGDKVILDVDANGSIVVLNGESPCVYYPCTAGTSCQRPLLRHLCLLEVMSSND